MSTTETLKTHKTQTKNEYRQNARFFFLSRNAD
jgi:hypothetical protein